MIQLAKKEANLHRTVRGLCEGMVLTAWRFQCPEARVRKESLDQQYSVFNSAETPVGQIWHMQMIEQVQEAGCRKELWTNLELQEPW